MPGNIGKSVVSPAPRELNLPLRPRIWVQSKYHQRKKLLPTGIMILGNYWEIGNALSYRKNCFQELFGPEIAIKSVMENLAAKVLFWFVLGINFRGCFCVLRKSSVKQQRRFLHLFLCVVFAFIGRCLSHLCAMPLLSAK